MVLLKDDVVNIAGKWSEGDYSYPSRYVLPVGKESSEAVIAG